MDSLIVDPMLVQEDEAVAQVLTILGTRTPVVMGVGCHKGTEDMDMGEIQAMGIPLVMGMGVAAGNRDTIMMEITWITEVLGVANLTKVEIITMDMKVMEEVIMKIIAITITIMDTHTRITIIIIHPIMEFTERVIWIMVKDKICIQAWNL